MSSVPECPKLRSETLISRNIRIYGPKHFYFAVIRTQDWGVLSIILTSVSLDLKF